MVDYDKTTRMDPLAHVQYASRDLLLTVFDGELQPNTVRLQGVEGTSVTFGRSPTNSLVLTSKLVSREHGRFCFMNGQWFVQDKGAYGDEMSKNGLSCNNTAIVSRALRDGDFIRIDNNVETVASGVLFVTSSAESANRWETVRVAGRDRIEIGRDGSCDIVLPHVSVSKHHASIENNGGNYYIVDNGSTNGVIVNNMPVMGRQLLHEKDVIVITNSKLIFSSSVIYYCCFKSGISVDAEDIVITRGKGSKKFITGNHINLNIKPGELVAIIGGSGAGKSTILNCMCGYLKPESGEVFINGTDLYRNFESLKKLIGYVPQSDIVYDNLTLYDMLLYTSKLRLPTDTSDAERQAAIDRAIDLVDLGEKKNSFIKRLSGGQRKRASIAVELLSDPNLLFLDEPSSGLDPGTERSLMTSLRKMADSGKTVILVTHSTLQLKMCDKIVFMGKGGNLCFFGSHDEALRFFGVSDIVDVYNMITDHAEDWRNVYNSTVSANSSPKRGASLGTQVRKSKEHFQIPVLCARYAKLILNDRQRLLLLILQAPLLGFLISIVAGDGKYVENPITKSLLFVLTCAAFWIGMLNSIQEICKERSILKREYMTGLSLNNYIASKLIVLGVLCLIQSLLLVSVYAIGVGLPEEGVVFHNGFGAYLEILLTTFLTALSATATGLFVSSLFSNADRAMTMAPILLLPQTIFSGMLFKLSGGFMTFISCLTLSRWSMAAYGTTANLNSLRWAEQEDIFNFEAGRFIGYIAILLLFTAVFTVLARLVLEKIKKENA